LSIENADIIEPLPLSSSGRKIFGGFIGGMNISGANNGGHCFNMPTGPDVNEKAPNRFGAFYFVGELKLFFALSNGPHELYGPHELDRLSANAMHPAIGRTSGVQLIQRDIFASVQRIHWRCDVFDGPHELVFLVLRDWAHEFCLFHLFIFFSLSHWNLLY